jgi:hypothetical protein
MSKKQLVPFLISPVSLYLNKTLVSRGDDLGASHSLNYMRIGNWVLWQLSMGKGKEWDDSKKQM